MSWKFWFRKHDRLLSAIGTLIVLLTFITKEQLRERWKDTAGALETAQSLSSLHDQLSAIAVKLNDLPLQAEDAAATDEILKHAGRETIAARAYGISSILADGADDIQEKFTPLVPLLDKINGHEAAKHRVRASLKRIVGLRQISYTTRKDYERARIEEAKKLGGADTPGMSEVRKELDSAIRKANELLEAPSEVQGIRDEILAAADGQVSWDRKAATYANSTSVVLYLFGVILSLAGKLADSGAEAPALVPNVE